MKDYNIFLFDADRTLFDFDESEKHALQSTLNTYGIAFDDNIFTFYTDINNKLWKELEQGRLNIDQLQLDRFIALFSEFNLSFDPVEINQHYLIELGKNNHLISGAEEVCESLFDGGKQLYIVTNGTASTQKSRFSTSPIKNYFSKIYISEEIGASKPQKEFFNYVFEDIKQDKRSMLIVGDSLYADIQGGYNAGIDSCWFNDHKIKNHTTIMPNYEIESLRQLLV